MMENAKPESVRALRWSWIPGLGHVVLGRQDRGFGLLAGWLSFIALTLLHFDRVAGAFATAQLDRWLATLTLAAVLAGFMVFSRRDVRRLLRPGGEHAQQKDPLRIALRRFRENRLALGSVWVIAGLYVVALLAPILTSQDPAAIPEVAANRYLPPSWTHPFGTDEFGRDLLSRALYGARVSLSVGLLAMVIAKSIGTAYGAISAFFGGFVDSVLMRIVDVWIAFPAIYLMLMLVGVFEAQITVLVLILGLTSWPGTARFIRGEILSLKQREFTDAARAIGLPNRQIIVRHLIPSAMSPVLVTAALSVAGMIGAESGLSFLGLGIRPPTPSWGNMIAAGQENLLFAWWMAFFPGCLLTITLVAFSLLADGLRDAMDPKALMQKIV